MGTTRDWTVRAYEDAEEASFWTSLAESGTSVAERRAVELVAPRAGARVLIVGCGTGRESLALARGGLLIVGVDVARRLVFEAIAHGRGRPNLAYGVADATSLPFRDDSFDHVFMISQMLGHIPERGLRRRALTEAARVVRSGGAVLVSVYNRYLKDYAVPYLLWSLTRKRPRSATHETTTERAVVGARGDLSRLGRVGDVASAMWRSRVLRVLLLARILRSHLLRGRKTHAREPRDLYIHPHEYRVSFSPEPGLAFYHLYTIREFLEDAQAAGLRVEAMRSIRELNANRSLPTVLRNVDFLHYYIMRHP